MHPSLPVVHTLALRTKLPNNFMVAGEALQMARFRTGLEGRELASKALESPEGQLEVAALLPSEISIVLTLLHEAGEIVTTAPSQDCLTVIEHSLA